MVGTALLDRLLTSRPDERFACLVQARHRDFAESKLAELANRHPDIAQRVRLVSGDLAGHGLGLSAEGDLRRQTTEIFHVAAVYDTTAPRNVVMSVNLDGTNRVLELARECAGLRRLHYVSSFGVSGHYPSVFHEEDLDVGQEFRNDYSESKFLAETAVRKAHREGLPVTIYRPGYVVGDTTTGATQKYDGPYFLIRWILRQPRALTIVPVIGDPKRTRPNIVPRDFVVNAMAYLSELDESLGRTYQLTDPAPLSLDEVVDTIAAAAGHRVVGVRMPLRLITRSLRVPAIERLVGIPPEVMEYWEHETIYDSTNTQRDLAGSGIACPPFPSYAPVLVEFVRDHPEIGTGPMV